MDIQALKLDLVQKLLSVNQVSVLDKVTQILDKEVVVAYTVDGKPLTRAQYLKDLEAAEKEADSGNFYTHEEVERKSGKW